MKQKLISVRAMYAGIVLSALMLLVLIIAFACAWNTLWATVLAVLCGLMGIVLLLSYIFVWRPYKTATRDIELIANLPLDKERYHMRWYYNRQIQMAMERVEEQIGVFTTMEVSKRRAQYQALQNQINPHFLYNTLESIRSEALVAGLVSVAKMCEALANFFRYTISNMEDLVTIEDEIRNIKTYFYIQQYRFGERLSLKIECDETDYSTIMKSLIPKLTLQPIVENAIIHGIEEKIEDGAVSIKLTLTEQRIIINISDDGVGIPSDTLDTINERIQKRIVSGTGKSGIAIGNVNNRIKIVFGEDYGVTVYSTPSIGTDVEITLRKTTEQDRASLVSAGGIE